MSDNSPLNILNFKQCQALTKLRIGNHRLEIELGWHNNIKEADRICKICNDGVEDETHFLVKCKNFENTRKPYLETIYTLFASFNIVVLCSIKPHIDLIQVQ